ncbi:type VI secretion system lipoprotein TssJ [Microbulbifer hydrolyticus]|uniref:Type VI secretion system lipoprotein TssJ n=2 Tax=Microbulbifer hydrolyticus TaxID=48074 RepID=A0A6P1TB21_9GAMM|nr:type VI secretion system lipoprotein TssJ [Microbulbifer hydrolyticus]MBB5211403.1 type VI secretion system protein VasD [Microbulbifer hydrolyticus]QHQ37842.1 type VI secretion system lipoprotein TssJ [Microbulbifer hydrolyticus]
MKLVLIAALAITVAACQTTRRTLNFDTSVTLDIDIEHNVNPDSDGRASPVVVRVFMLADDRQFSREEFLNLYENAESRLGKDLLDTVILKEFAPGEQRVEELSLTPEVRYIGLLAEFVQYRRAEALMLLPITEYKKNTYGITLEGTRIASTQALDMRRRTAEKIRDESKEATVTISSAEYERLRELQKTGKR